MKILLLSFIVLSSVQLMAQTLIQDPAFEQKLIDLGYDSGPIDGVVTTANINTLSSLDVTFSSINSLAGIEDFVSLTTLNCSANQLTNLDVSQNSLLTDLDCSSNQLVTLNVSSVDELSNLNCRGNLLVDLEVSQNLNLVVLDCGDNDLTTLDLNNNSALTTLLCDGNLISSLDVSQIPFLSTLNCSENDLSCLNANNGSNLTAFTCTFNPLLMCVSILDPSIAQGLFYYDAQTGFSQNCTVPVNNDVDQLGMELTAQQSDASYQWLDCDNNNSPIFGANGQSYTTTSTGNYAVEVTLLHCSGVTVGVSACIHIDCLSEIDNDVSQTGSWLHAEHVGAQYQWLDCGANYAPIGGETDQDFTPFYTGYFAVEITISDSCGGTQIDTSSCHLVDFTSLDELNSSQHELVKIVDVMGRETEFKANSVLLYIYSDGKIERVFKLEE